MKNCRSCRHFANCRQVAADSVRQVTDNMEYLASFCKNYNKALRPDDISTPWDNLTKQEWCIKTSEQFRLS